MQNKRTKLSLYSGLLMIGGYAMASQTPIDQKIKAEPNSTCLSIYLPGFLDNMAINAPRSLWSTQTRMAYLTCLRKKCASACTAEPAVTKVVSPNTVRYSLCAQFNGYPDRFEDYLAASMYGFEEPIGRKEFLECIQNKKTGKLNCYMAQKWSVRGKRGNFIPQGKIIEKGFSSDNEKTFAALKDLYNLQTSL